MCNWARIGCTFDALALLAKRLLRAEMSVKGRVDMVKRQPLPIAVKLPAWLPDAARHYLFHTEKGLSIRALARESKCHPSTVLRQVRRFECRRDDPLIDAALKSFSDIVLQNETDQKKEMRMSNMERVQDQPAQAVTGLTKERIESEAKRILRRLCESGAVLAVMTELETAVVVRDAADGEQMRTAMVDRDIAQAMALKDWIACDGADGGRVTRYFITNTGRAALRELMAKDENKAQGFAERRATFDHDDGWDRATLQGLARHQSRYCVTESPLVGLARRKDRDGQPFLERDLVAAGERLREDYELAQMTGPKIDGWETAITDDAGQEKEDGAVAARRRVRQALADLGPGLGDIVLRCCCFLEGLETTEKSWVGLHVRARLCCVSLFSSCGSIMQRHKVILVR